MNTLELVAKVAAATEVVKKTVNAIFHKDLVTGAVAVVFSVIVSAVVVLIEAVNTGAPVNLSLLPVFISVVVLANGGFQLLKILAPKKEVPGV